MELRIRTKRRQSGVIKAKCKLVKTPYMEREIGYRLVAAYPNRAGRTMSGQECTSYRRPYLFAVSSDHTLMTNEIRSKFETALKSCGFEKVCWEDLK